MRYNVGIDLGGMSAKAGLADETGKLLGILTCKTFASEPPELLADRLSELIDSLCRACSVPREEIGAVGIGSPGVIDSERGTVVLWSNFGWKDVPIASLVSERVKRPVYVTNDANAAALGEAEFGSGKGFSDSVLVTLGTGVGGGIVLGGKLFEGYRSAGAEIGHMVVRQNGLRCACGRRGCYECYASATALKRMTAEAIARHPDSKTAEIARAENEITGKTAFVAARAGDPVGRGVVKRYIENVGEGIANLVNLLRPQAILLGGGISREGERFLAGVRAVVEKRVYASVRYAPLSVLLATLGNDAGIYGAAAYARAHAR